MNRRSAIRTMVIVSAGGVMLSSCLDKDRKNSIALKKVKVSEDQQDMLAVLTQCIIPTTDSPGAKELKSHEFALRMIDDCSSPEDQQKFINGMRQFEEFIQKRSAESFTGLAKGQRSELLTYLENKKNDVPKEVAGFYRTVKGLTLQSYTGSEYYMTNVVKYNMIPKKYKGCIAVNHA